MTDRAAESSTSVHDALVVGSGLIGASIGQALSAVGVDVWLSDSDEEAVRTAGLLGAGRPARARPESGSALDLAVVAVPPGQIAAVVADLVRSRVAQTIIHVCSVQTQPRLEILREVGQTGYVVGTHPMAGRERGGAAGASPHLFQDRPWVVCPDGAAPPAMQTARWLVRACGGIEVSMTAIDHDAAVAAVSHLPQLVSSALAARLCDESASTVAVAGTGLRDVTRLAESDPGLWADIITANAGFVAERLAGLVAELEELLHNLQPVGEDRAVGRAAVADLIGAGRTGRDRLSGKHGARPRHWAAVSLVIPDRPGALVEALTVTRDHDINVEDLRVEHGSGHPLGVLELLVDPTVAHTLAAALTAAGWDIAGVALPHD